jgi:hypothetical protein
VAADAGDDFERALARVRGSLLRLRRHGDGRRLGPARNPDLLKRSPLRVYLD